MARWGGWWNDHKCVGGWGGSFLEDRCQESNLLWFHWERHTYQGFKSYIYSSAISMQGSYRLWNSGKTMEFWKGNSIYGKTMEFEQNDRTYGKNYGIFVLVEKSACFLKKMGGKYVRTSMFVASVITSLGLALRTSRAKALASAEWIPAGQLTLFVP